MPHAVQAHDGGSPAHSGLAAALEPVLHEVCEHRLGPVEWFHAAWQRGGASTGFSTYRMRNSQQPVPVLVKFPIGPVEYEWTTGLGCVTLCTACDDEEKFVAAHDRATPRVLAHGTQLGSYDMAWVVTERLAGDHLPRHMNAAMVTELMTRVLEFHQAAGKHKPVAGRYKSPDWSMLLERARHLSHEHAIADFQQWSEAIRHVLKHLPSLQARWEARTIDTWCHGDLHVANALRRVAPGCTLAAPGDGPCVLIDLALVHPGNWIEDALYLERQYWGHEEWIGHVKPVSLLARLRREAGLPTVGDYNELANLRRVLMGACAPALIAIEGSNQKYLKSALRHVQEMLPMVVH
jgi:hypothetical protein